MPKPKNQANTGPQIVVSFRALPTLVDRLDWLARNDEANYTRTEAIRHAVESYVKAREDACRKKGLTPPT
jgi:predicted transcriptional regulator